MWIIDNSLNSLWTEINDCYRQRILRADKTLISTFLSSATIINENKLNFKEFNYSLTKIQLKYGG